MNSFENYFSLYEATDPPPIITEDYKLVQDNYKQYLNPVTIPDVQVFNQTENPLSIVTEPPTLYKKQGNTNPISSKVQSRIKSNSNKMTSKADYVKTMYKYLYAALENNGINGDIWAPVLVAQTSIESNWGNEFSRKNNNFAGIKGKGSGLVKTKEWSPEKGYYTIKDSFKSYPSIDAFADDYVKRLKNRFKAFEGTPEDFSKNIRSRGYFTAKLEDYQRMMDSRLDNVIQLLQS